MENYFKKIVKTYKLSQKSLVPILNKSYSAITHYMDGSRHPDIETFIILSKYLKIPLDELLEINVPNEPEELIIIPKHDYDLMKELISKLDDIINKK